MVANPNTKNESWGWDPVHTPQIEPPFNPAVQTSSAHTGIPGLEPESDQAMSKSSGHHSRSDHSTNQSSEHPDSTVKPHGSAADNQPSGHSKPQSELHFYIASKQRQSSGHSEHPFHAAPGKQRSHFEPQHHAAATQGNKGGKASRGASSGSGSHALAPAKEATQDSSKRQSKSRDEGVAEVGPSPKRVKKEKGAQAEAEAGASPKHDEPSKSEKKPSFWTEEEHELFLIGLQKFTNRTPGDGTSQHPLVGLGPGVAELISEYLGTRSAAQVRSHAQKHFIKRWKDKDAK